MKPSEVKYIVIHCSATRSNMGYTPWQLDQDHRARGFRSAGYHFYIRRSGEIITLRQLNEVGAHAAGVNRCSIGVCYEGGILPNGAAADTRTEGQKKALEYLLRILVDDFPWAKIVGHRDLSHDRNGNGVLEPNEWFKQCPCFDAANEYKHLLQS